MPELPEVETTCRGIRPHIIGKTISQVIVRQKQLRWPIPDDLNEIMTGLSVKKVGRRAKYLFLETNSVNTVLLHLGMSGNLRITNIEQMPEKHDHVDFVFSDKTVLRFNDTRRFGAILYTPNPIDQHKLIIHLGPEPLSDQLTGDYLYQLSRDKKVAIKNFIMNAHNVVGVGNIYASESLFRAKIHPTRQAGKISLKRYKELSDSIKYILEKAIAQGGTTLRDFVNEQGSPGYFQQSLSVYGRANQKCILCKSTIKQIKIAQRASYYCSQCQH